MSVQLGWFLTGIFIMVLLTSSNQQWHEDKHSAIVQLGLAILILILSISRIIVTW